MPDDTRERVRKKYAELAVARTGAARAGAGQDLGVVEENGRGITGITSIVGDGEWVGRLVALGQALSDPIRVRKLKEAGLILEEKRGKWSYYSLDRGAVQDLLGEAIGRFAGEDAAPSRRNSNPWMKSLTRSAAVGKRDSPPDTICDGRGFPSPYWRPPMSPVVRGPATTIACDFSRLPATPGCRAGRFRGPPTGGHFSRASRRTAWCGTTVSRNRWTPSSSPPATARTWTTWSHSAPCGTMAARPSAREQVVPCPASTSSA